MTKLLELGPGQGRDTLFFAREGFQVTALDYSQAALGAIMAKALVLGLRSSVEGICHDVRTALPLQSDSFDACYSHMLYCMALTTAELEFLFGEVWRVLRPGGFNVYTVRHTGDAHYRTGIHRGEDMYEVGGFIVHFFDRQKVEHLAAGYELVGIAEFQEGGLPRKLFRVTLRKPGAERATKPVRLESAPSRSHIPRTNQMTQALVPTLGGVTPILRVERLDISIPYYVEQLGFHLEWRSGIMASVGRDRTSLMLCQGDQGRVGTLGDRASAR